MLTDLEPLPTLDEIKKIINTSEYYVGAGAFRTVYRKSGSRWVIKSTYDAKVNEREYANYLRIKPSMSNPSLRLPEMHMVGEYLIAEYVDGIEGDENCWNSNIKWAGDWKAYYTKGCADPDNCSAGANCWAELTKEISATVADLHSNNVRVTNDGTVYIIDLGEH